LSGEITGELTEVCFFRCNATAGAKNVEMLELEPEPEPEIFSSGSTALVILICRLNGVMSK